MDRQIEKIKRKLNRALARFGLPPEGIDGLVKGIIPMISLDSLECRRVLTLVAKVSSSDGGK